MEKEPRRVGIFIYRDKFNKGYSNSKDKMNK